MRRYANQKTAPEIASDKELLTQGRSLINIRMLLQEGRRALEEGDPIIYAIEVAGPADQVEALTTQEPVDAVHFPDRNEGSTTQHDSLKPKAFMQEHIKDAPQNMNGYEVYDWIRSRFSGDS
jgi:hypothetical protein